MSVTNVTAVELRPSSKQESMVKAFGRVTLEDKLVLDVLVMDKGEGPWASFPNGRKGSDGKFYLPVFFKDRDDDKAFKAKVIEEYERMRGSSSAPSARVSTPSQSELPF